MKLSAKPRRILIFSFAYYPRFIGGAEVTIKEVTDRISPNDVEFDMVTLRLDPTLPKFERIGNVNIHRIGWTKKTENSPDSLSWYLHMNKYAYIVLAALKAASLHRKNKYDAIWSLMASYSSFAAVFFKLIHKRVPFIFTLQDGDPIPYMKRRALPLYPFFKMMFTKANYIQAISKYLADWARDMGAKCPVDVVPNAVDIKLFTKEVEERDTDALKKKFFKKESTKSGKNGKSTKDSKEGEVSDVFLITTSRLVVKNAVGDIITALSFLPKNFKLLILGVGYQEAELKQQALRLGLNYTDEPPINPGNRVHFVGYVPHSEMLPYLKISEIFVRPALSEGLGNSFLEAMAAKIPVIATPVGGIPDFLRDGETGLFCEVKNPKSIAQKVEKLTKDAESRAHIVEQAYEMVIKNYTWEKVAADMQQLFVSVAHAGADRSATTSA